MYPKNDTILYHHIYSFSAQWCFSFICSVDKFNSTKIVCAPAPDKNPMLSNFQILWIPDAMLPICTYMYVIRLYGTQRRSKRLSYVLLCTKYYLPKNNIYFVDDGVVRRDIVELIFLYLSNLNKYFFFLWN